MNVQTILKIKNQYQEIVLFELVDNTFTLVFNNDFNFLSELNFQDYNLAFSRFKNLVSKRKSKRQIELFHVEHLNL